jgi:hypothetical protein
VKAFSVAWRALGSFYNDLFFLAGMSLLWWVTGGVFAGAAIAVWWILLGADGPWWLAPLLAIPSGPASAAIANVARASARDLHVDRSAYLEGLRLYWRRALALSAISLTVMSLLLLNVIFYSARTATVLWLLTFLWAYLSVFWIGAQMYLYAILVGLEAPSVSGALRMAAGMVLANPFFSIVLLVLASILSGLGIALAITLFAAWPAVMALLGEHSVKLFVEQAAQKSR